MAKVNAAGTALVYCGYIGGTGVDIGNGIAVDASGNAYVAGTSDSRFQFPVKVGPDLVHHDGNDAFVAKVSASGAAFVYCGFIGGSGDDLGNAIAVDAAGIAYVAGATDSAVRFPGRPADRISSRPGPRTPSSPRSASTGDRLLYNGFLGGSLDDEAAGIAADGAGNVYVTGTTHSANFPVAVGPLLTPGGGLCGRLRRRLRRPHQRAPAAGGAVEPPCDVGDGGRGRPRLDRPLHGRNRLQGRAQDGRLRDLGRDRHRRRERHGLPGHRPERGDDLRLQGPGLPTRSGTRPIRTSFPS